MSCGTPDAAAEEGEALMPRRRVVQKTDPKTCTRCKAARATYIVRALRYCRACFLSSMYTRFKRNVYEPLRVGPIGKQAAAHRPRAQKGQVLIALSGGAGSMAMLDQLLQAGLIGKGDGAKADKTKGEKDVVWDKGTVVYVEFAGVTGMQDRMAGMQEVATSRGLGFRGMRAEDVFDVAMASSPDGHGVAGPSVAMEIASQDLPLYSSSSKADPLTRLRNFLNSLPPASRPSLLQHILSHSLNLAACQPGISHLMLGETSTREAQRVISGTATGRGWALPVELALAAPIGVGSEVVRIKPMKDIALKEAAIYCHLRGMSMVNQRQWADGRSTSARGKGSMSLEMLTEQFIAGLSVSHPSTVSTINKTGDKLVFAGRRDTEDVCPLCQMPAEPSAQAWKSRTALTSLTGKSAAPDGVPGQPERPPGVALAGLLCYACLTTMTPHTSARKADASVDPPRLVDLPTWVGERVNRRVGEEEMREVIGGFLLSEDG